ncbi:hypothetical protein [Humisphaera borealis]|uniref:Uncharacterized protein n=1 Tax=Humisphaera borealis TaxID=2807512 RepID=A0A7M2WQM9_9BACT|nr:hypothetical protein [Humisphaera borealis]QOV87723.1 hypothetical protein IPV69_15675 [Humisphaera borealis]
MNDSRQSMSDVCPVREAGYPASRTREVLMIERTFAVRGAGRAAGHAWEAEQIAVVRRRIGHRRVAMQARHVAVDDRAPSVVKDRISEPPIEDLYEDAERWDGMA